MKDKNDSSKLSLSLVVLKGGFIHNPVLTQVLGVCPIAAAATTTKNAVVLSVVFTFAVVLCELVSSLALKKAARNVRVCLYCLLASIPTILSMSLFGGKTASALGAFLPLISVNAIIVVRCEKFAVKTNVRGALFDSLACSAGFSAVALITGLLRELLSSGSVFSLKISALPVFSAFALPFGGLVILGLLAAVQKAIVMKRFENESHETFNFSKIYEKPVLHDPGLGIRKSKKEKVSKPDTAKHDNIRPRHSDREISFTNETEEK